MSTAPSGVWAHYHEQGPEDAPRIVLVPPLGGSGELFEPFRTDLARDHRVLTCEPPGSGTSGAPKGVPSTRALAADVLVTLEKLEVTNACLFGISLGGMIAQWLAIDAPQRFTRLVFASTAARGLTSDLNVTDALAFARALIAPGNAQLAMTKEIVDDETLADDAERARITTAVLDNPHDRGELLWLAAAAAAHDAREELATVLAPALVLTGARDALFSLGTQRALASLLPHGEHRVIDDAGHDVTVDAPAAVAAAIRTFMRA